MALTVTPPHGQAAAKLAYVQGLGAESVVAFGNGRNDCQMVKAAGLGLNPLNDGKVLKIPIPPLDEERRREIVKGVKKMLEDEKTALRNIRRETKEFIEELEKEKEISEDDKFKGLEELQKITDDFTKKTEDVAAAKEKEIMQV